MINKAIAKITDEMMKMDDPLAQMIEEHLTKMCTTQSIAEKLLDPGKTLEGIHKKIWDEARRRKKKVLPKTASRVVVWQWMPQASKNVFAKR